LSEDATGNRTYRSLLAIFFVLVVIICLGGYRFYSAQRGAAEQEVTNELQAIVDLKAEQIIAWRRERLADAQVITADRAFLVSIHAVVIGHAPTGKREEVLSRLANLCDAYQYANAVLLDLNGKEILHHGQLYGGAAHFSKILAELATHPGAVLRDLNTADGGGLHLGLNIPLRLPGDKKLFGLLSFAVDPERYLFPMVDRWPGPVRDGETLLVRRDGEEALYLNKQDPNSKTSTRMRLSLSKRDAVAVKALNGESGLIRGRDRQGRPVVAAARALPGSQWLVFAQLPLEAIDKPIRDRAMPVSLAVVSLILAAGMAAAYLWRVQERRYDEARQSAELEKQALFTHYNFLSRSASDAIFLVNEQGRIVEANDRAVEMYGFSREELLSMNAAALQASDSQHGAPEFWRRAEEQPEALIEAVHTRKDGSTFPAEVSALQIDVEGVTYHQAIIRDITQRNRAKRQLENANRLYAVLSQCNQAILRAATEQELFDGVCEAAVQEGGFPLAIVTRVDQESQDVHPIAAAGPAQAYLRGIQLSARLDASGLGTVGTSIRDGATAVSHDIEHDPRMSAWRERAARSGLQSGISVPVQRGGRIEFAFGLYAFETSFFNPPEIRLVEEIVANVSYALGRLDEESARKAAEEALLQSEVRYRHLVESAPLGMYVHKNGVVSYMNSEGLRMLGASSMSEVVGTEVLRFIHPDDRAVVDERIRKLKLGEPAPLLEERFVRLDGSILYVEVSAVPIQFEGEDAIFVFVVDATQRKKAEEERARMEEQFLQAQKMESVGRLAGGVAHDFNNNLTVINGYCDLLLSSLDAGDPIRAQISLVRKAGDQAAKLTRQLLTFSHKQVFSQKHVDLNELVVEAKSLFSRLIGERIRIQTRLDPALPSVLADPTQIHQVLMNLAINARDAMPDGGDLVIATDSVHLAEEQTARVVGARAGHFVALTVSDTGVGMDAETRRHIFEPFFTTKPRGSGTGLGLATVYGIVQQSGGWVEVESAPGQGTTFRILLPAVAGTAAPDAEVSSKVTPGHETVLLVEDQADVRLLTSTILESLGYAVLEADSGAKALEISGQFQGRIDLLLTDVIMPGMTGRGLAKRLRKLRPSIKVLLVSGYAEDDGLEGRGGESELDLLPKPFTPSALAAKVREILRR
jgi:PAS domain S-box-containing protein